MQLTLKDLAKAAIIITALVLAMVLPATLLSCTNPTTHPTVTAPLPTLDVSRTQEKTRTQWLIADKVTVQKGGLDASGAVTFSGGTTLDSVTVSGAAALDGGITVDTTNLIVDGSTGNVTMGADLDVSGKINVSGIELTAGSSTYTVVGSAPISPKAMTIVAAQGFDIYTNGFTTVITDATGVFQVLTGSLTIGNDTPTLTQDGEDLYVEGTSELHILQVDGATYHHGNALIFGLAENMNLTGNAGVLMYTTPATGTFNVKTGNLSVGNASPNPPLNGEDFYVEGGAQVGGTSRLNGPVLLSNYLYLGGQSIYLDEALSASILGTAGNIDVTVPATSTVDIVGGGLTVDGYASYSIEPTIVTTNTNVAATAKRDAQILQNSGTLAVTMTLPDAAAGLSYCFYNYDGDDVLIDVQTGDQIHVLTNATGDKISNTTAGNHICLLAIDGTYWIALSASGTWTDAD